MKTQMIIGGILFGVAACTAPADGYRITGNIEGAGDGKAILLQSAGFEEPTMGDTVNMRNGKFVFEGRLESPVSVTVKVCPDSDQPASLGFIAENSPIRVIAIRTHLYSDGNRGKMLSNGMATVRSADKRWKGV